MRTHRSSPGARALRAGAALLTAGVLAAGLLTPSAEASGAAPDGLPAAPSPADPGGEHAKIAQEVMEDPIGQAGMEAHEALHVEDGGRNLAIIWFDVTDFPPHVYKKITKHFKNLDFNVRFPGSRKKADGRRYEGRGRILRYAGKEALFDRLGVSQNRTVLELTAVNVPVNKAQEAHDPRGVHSEALIYERILRPFLERLSLSTEEINELLGKAVGGFSDRARCPKCEKITIKIPAENFKSIVSYDPNEKLERRNRIGAIISNGTKIVRKRKREQEAKAKQAMPVDGSAAGCVSMGVGSGPRPVMAMTLPLAADDDCGEGENRAGSGALPRALDAPAGADAYGGVDFSTLEMRYISDGSDGVRYAYSAKTLPDEYQQDSDLGTQVVQNFGADLRTWLALDPQKFWVNLNPTEPDRIVDAALGQTNAGRAMLEADLQMKRTEAKILHPDSVTGKRFWREIRPSADGSLCFSSRMWIVPGQIEVREDGDAFYILKALLDVKTESMNIDDPYAGSCDSDPVVDAHNENLVRTLVLPEIVKAVNTAPEYVPLRRAFMARIIAQWIRERHQQGHRTSFDDVIDSKELGASKLDGSWRPKDVFDDYVHSYRHKEFDVTRRTTEGRVTRVTRYSYGGADLTQVDLTTVGEAEMRERYPRLAEFAQASTKRQVTADDGSVWLGGSTTTPEQGFWDGLKDDADRVTGGNSLVLAVIALALGGLFFGFRTRPRRRGRPAT